MSNVLDHLTAAVRAAVDDGRSSVEILDTVSRAIFHHPADQPAPDLLMTLEGGVKRGTQPVATWVSEDGNRPRWNCVDFPGEGMHYVPGDHCVWCGRPKAEVWGKAGQGPERPVVTRQAQATALAATWAAEGHPNHDFEGGPSEAYCRRCGGGQSGIQHA